MKEAEPEPEPCDMGEKRRVRGGEKEGIGHAVGGNRSLSALVREGS